LLAIVLAGLWSCCGASNDGDATALRLVVLDGNDTAVASRRILHTEARLASTRHPAAAAGLPDTQYVLAIPASALDWSRSPPVVTAIRNGEAVQVEVEVSIVDESQGLAGIRSGLQLNERVVIGPDRNLTPGTPVRIEPNPSDEASPLGQSASDRCAERELAPVGKTRCTTGRARRALLRERRHRITAKLPAACLSRPHAVQNHSMVITSPRSEASWTSSECSGHSTTRSLAPRSAWSATSASPARSG
jgi:hypothetical protein